LRNWSYRNVAMVDEAPMGPPLVVTQTRSNNCRAPMIDRKSETRSVGPSRGSVMYRNDCHDDAPWIDAASCTSRGSCCSPARMITMWKPKYFHEMMKKRLYRTSSG